VKVLFAARLVDFKDPLTFVKAACADATQDFQFTVAGDGVLFKECERLAEGHNNVKLLGWVKQDVVNELMREADIFCQLSPYENLWAASLISAMKYGKAVICTDVGYVRKYLRADYHVVLIPARNHIALIEAIVKLANDGELRRMLGENASIFVKEKMSLESVCREIRGMLLDVTSVYHLKQFKVELANLYLRGFRIHCNFNLEVTLPELP